MSFGRPPSSTAVISVEPGETVELVAESAFRKRTVRQVWSSGRSGRSASGCRVRGVLAPPSGIVLAGRGGRRSRSGKGVLIQLSVQFVAARALALAALPYILAAYKLLQVQLLINFAGDIF